MKRVLVYMLAGMALVGTSCSDFLDTIPHDALSPSTTWQTEKDAEKFLIGCYDGWADETGILYWDCASDFGFNFHVHENYRNIGNGSRKCCTDHGNQLRTALRIYRHNHII